MELKKILYSLICVGGFAIAFVGLRVVGNALMGVGGIMLCIYGLLEAMHLFSTSPKTKSQSMYSPVTPEAPEAAEASERPNFCPHCGAQIPAENDFCGKCGKKIA